MSDDPTLQELLEVQALFGLPSPALVEKDYHVVRALRAITSTDTTPFRLVFGGGTALSRAHRLLRRMSEDIDLKIIGDEPIRRQDLRALREALTASLLAHGFEFDPTEPAHRESRNESRYTIFRLPYEPLSRGEAALRPAIQIEVAVWPLRRESIELSVSSFVAEAFEREPEVPRIECVSVTQTAAEKFVALTRRTAAELAGAGGSRDAADIRHVYDLHMLREHYDPAEVAALVHDIMPHDVQLVARQFPAYRDDPVAETRRAVEALVAEGDYARRYDDFCRLMVYGDSPPYEVAIAMVQNLTELLQEF